MTTACYKYVGIEQPCPKCNRVHYSIYTMERCVARHQILREWADYADKKGGKKHEQVLQQTSEVKRGELIG